jgi:aspartate aminotransferase
MSVISARIKATDAAFEPLKSFYFGSRYGERRLAPGICDFTFGNPHEMPFEGLVAAIRERAIPHDKNWAAARHSSPIDQEAKPQPLANACQAAQVMTLI